MEPEDKPESEDKPEAERIPEPENKPEPEKKPEPETQQEPKNQTETKSEKVSIIENSFLVITGILALLAIASFLFSGPQFIFDYWWWISVAGVLIFSGIFYRKNELIVSGIVLLSATFIVFSNAIIFSFNPDLLTMDWFKSLIIIGFISSLVYVLKLIEKKDISLIFTLFLIITIATTFYYIPSSQIPKTHGTVLSPNWFQALNWIKDNTAECATIATYWDPGHFITGIAERPVIYDGTSQSSLRHLHTNETGGKQGLEEINYENGIVQLVLREDGNITKARMKDVAISMLTENESLAIENLKNYLKPGCNEMYFIASSDLISKSQWWTYFATWAPTKIGTCQTLENPKGDCYFYNMISLANAKPQPTQNAIVYTYPMSQNQAFLLYEINNTMKPYLQQGGMLATVEKIFYYTREGAGFTHIYPEADVKGLIWLSPDRQIIIYIPPELENALFTKMYFFNGYNLNNQPLEHFEFINNWGGEVKLFKVKF